MSSPDVRSLFLNSKFGNYGLLTDPFFPEILEELPEVDLFIITNWADYIFAASDLVEYDYSTPDFTI